MELLKNISFWITFITGCGGMLILLCITWNYLFTYILNLLKVKSEFVEFIYDKRKRGKKIFKPEINK